MFTAIKAAANKDLRLIPAEAVRLHACLDAIWHVARPYASQQNPPQVGSKDYGHLKTVFNNLMLVNEARVRQWIQDAATTVHSELHSC